MPQIHKRELKTKKAELKPLPITETAKLFVNRQRWFASPLTENNKSVK